MVSWGLTALNIAPPSPIKCKPKPVPCPQPAPAPAPVKPAPAPAPVPPKPAPAPGQTDVHYPETDNKDVNAAIKEHIDKLVEDFKARALKGDDAAGATYKLTYEGGFVNNNIVSFRFDIVEKITGDATPVHKVFTLMYDLNSGKELKNRTLFANRNYADELSRLVREGLQDTAPFKGNEAALELLEKGTAPKAANFENLFVQDGKLYILFAPGQISSDAEVKEFVIPVADHQELFSKDFLVR